MDRDRVVEFRARYEITVEEAQYEETASEDEEEDE